MYNILLHIEVVLVVRINHMSGFESDVDLFGEGERVGGSGGKLVSSAALCSSSPSISIIISSSSLLSAAK
ncbi:hypothetical protein SERLADRAFT_480664 [Serpula lacrymans var. lacrymans S7.9]|uniref:Uncharacterized protein n=1 Tax=Serpula lacrymans var. lacrymans (strain S7.9) TaxID=578457 RepID=F8PDW6_SERL9|nr:uncharacterized protein SERLADRAFT_480664 [Serpula lacrymans var. lacrymans S7.9]EGO18563.1 hypothetical protein SERLADRAFT_480664 [Serpula lacrymans var. lacrymans S7.9]